MRTIKIKQHDITDCGAACIASISGYYGLQMPIAEIRQIAHTDRKGTNVLGLIVAAEKLGFSAKGVKALTTDGKPNYAPLLEIPLPAIAHLVVNGRLLHYVVIYKATDNWLQIMDPGTGNLEKWDKDKFLSQWTGVLVLMLPDEVRFHKGNNKISTSRRLLLLLKPHKAVILQSVFGALIYTALGLSTSIYVQKIVDFVLPNSNTNLLNLMGVIMVIILIVGTIINVCKSLFILKTGQIIDARLILGYYKHLMKLPQSFFDNMQTGEIISRIGDAMKIRDFISNSLISLIVGIFTVIFSFILMFTYYWKLALIILISIPLYSIVYYVYNKVNKNTQRRLMEHAASLEAHLVESLNLIRTIKCFGIEEHTSLNTESQFIKLLNTAYRSAVNAITSNTASNVISQLFTVILLWSGSYYVIGGYITPGELLSFYALIGYFISPVGGIIGMNLALQDAKIASDRLFDIMDLDGEDNNNKITIGKGEIGDITFNNVSFSYGTRSTIFSGLNLRIAHGKMTAIVGESGSGKSTLAVLIQGLYSISEGSIKIGDIDISHIDLDSLRSIIGVVPQKVELFTGSIVENIAVGDYAPDFHRILMICKSIGLLDFIESLPTGFNTDIGEDGLRLSGGQRQRIAIARALYRDPSILILDEATSSLDAHSEEYIKRLIADLKEQGKTIIVIAHRVGTITSADNIIVLNNGKVVEEGVHSSLMNHNGPYRKLVATQVTN